MKKFSQLSKKINIGLALGGGGARGLAHIGVIKVLESMGIKPSHIVGTSMGSIIGCLYAYLQDAVLLETKLVAHLKSNRLSKLGLTRFSKKQKEVSIASNIQQLLKRLSNMYMLTTAVTKSHLIEEETFKELITLLIPDTDIERLAIPFAAVATDLKSGVPHVFDHGSLHLATSASSAIPGIFPPVSLDNKQLIDGSCLALVPVEQTFALGADVVIAVDVSEPMETDKLFKTGMEIWFRADQLTSLALRNQAVAKATFNITFDNLNYKWHDFHSVEEIIKVGEDQAHALLPDLSEALIENLPLPWWKRLFIKR